MCPDPQLLSIYMDGELPSPWKEKMEGHLSECSECMEKFKSFKHLQELFKKDTSQKRTVESSGHVSEGFSSEQELMETSMKKVWQKLEAQSNEARFYRTRSAGMNSHRQRQLRPVGIRQTNLWKHKLSIPLPAAAVAAAIIIVLGIAALLFRGGSVDNNTFAKAKVESADKTNFIPASEEEVSGVIPTGSINDVLQYLTSNGTDIIILQLPESSNFSRVGEPAIIKAADYTRRNQ